MTNINKTEELPDVLAVMNRHTTYHCMYDLNRPYHASNVASVFLNVTRLS